MSLPEYDITGNSLMIKFIAPENRIVHGPSKNGTVNLSSKEIQILELLVEAPAYTYQALADKLGIGRKAVFSIIIFILLCVTMALGGVIAMFLYKSGILNRISVKTGGKPMYLKSSITHESCQH